MSPSEIIDLLTLAAAYDQRTVGEGDVAAWHQALFKLDSDEAQAAVIAYYQENTTRIMPADIYRRCRPPATRHLQAVPAKVVSDEPADPERWNRMWQAAVAGSEKTAGERRALVLSEPEIAQRLCDPPLGYKFPEQWNGFIPPELHEGGRNTSRERKALLAIVDAATGARAGGAA